MIVHGREVDALAQHMIRTFAADAAARAVLRSDAFFVLGQRETSEKWLRVSKQIKMIQDDEAATVGAAGTEPLRPCARE